MCEHPSSSGVATDINFTNELVLGGHRLYDMQ